MQESAAGYISVLFPQHGYLGLLKQIRRSQEIQIQQHPQRAWHYEESKFYMLQASFMHAHTNGIIWVQLSADVLPLTPIFLTHYKQIILLTHPVKQTELSIICILLLFKLPNKHFSGFMDGGTLTGQLLRRHFWGRKNFVSRNPVVLLCYSLLCVWEAGEEPCCKE